MIAIRSTYHWALTVLLGGPAAACTILLLVAEVSWIGDMLTFATPWLGAISLLLLAVSVPLRLWVTAIAALSLAGVTGYSLIGAWNIAPGTGADPIVRITTYNTLHGATDVPALAEFLEVTQPRILVLQELPPSSSTKLWQLLDDSFPYRSGNEETGDALVVFSSFPILGTTTVSDPSAASLGIGAPTIRVEIETDEGPLLVYAVHAPTPRLGQDIWKLRNQRLDELAQSIAAAPSDTPIVVAGDFNTPPWSPFFRSLLGTASLTDTAGRPVPASTRISRRDWLPHVIGAPVDHILVSADVGWKQSSVGSAMGSDHRPVTVDVSLPASESSGRL